jgi:hypothetical protein
MRQAARIDANQKEIVEGLRKLGYSVWITSSLGKGSPDIVIGARSPDFGGFNILLELKDGNKCESQRKLTPLEDAFHKTWRGQIDVVNNLDEAVALIGRYVRMD